MKKLIALILMAFSMASIAQTITPIAGDYQYNGNVYFQKGMFIPVRDTIPGYLYRVGAASIRPADTVGHPLTVPVYVWTGSRWFNVAGGGAASYTAGNGLTLSGSQFRLGGTLDANTSILTGAFGFNVNASQTNRNTLYLGPGTGGTSRIGYNNPDGSYGGYEYQPDFGRGKSNFYTKGFIVSTLDYAGLRIADSTGANKINLNTDGTIVLKQANGNSYLEAASNKLLLSGASDTAFYVDDTRAQFRALANVDPLKVVSADQFGALQLVTSPSANTIYTSDGTISDERTITGATTNGVSWNSFNAFSINEDDGAGNTAGYGFYPYGFSWAWTDAGSVTSGFNYNSNAFSLSLVLPTGYNVTTQENAQVGQGYSIYEKQTGAITNNERIEFQQGFSADSSVFSIRHYKTNWFGDPGRIFDIDSFGTVKLQRYKNNSAEDSVLSTDPFGRVKMRFAPSSTENIYNTDGTLTGQRQVHLNGNALQIIDDGSTYGETKFLMSATGSISATAKAPAGDPNVNYPGVMNVSPYGTYVGSEGRAHLTHADVDTISARLLFNSFSDFNAHVGYENKAGVDSAGFFVSHGFIDHPSIVNTTLLRVDSTGNTSTLKISSPIHNAYNTSGIPFTSYYNLSHDGVDTSKKAWSIGLMGTPATSGPTTPTGDSLKFRSCNNSGVFFTDVMTLARQGFVSIPGSLTLGVVNGSGQPLLVNGSAKFTKDIAVVGTGNTSFVRESKSVTVTGDYTVLQADLYINVNNSSNCTITLPLSPTSVFHIKKISNNASTVTIIGPNGTELIDGSISYVMSAFNDHATIREEDATNYYIY